MAYHFANRPVTVSHRVNAETVSVKTENGVQFECKIVELELVADVNIEWSEPDSDGIISGRMIAA